VAGSARQCGAATAGSCELGWEAVHGRIPCGLRKRLVSVQGGGARRGLEVNSGALGRWNSFVVCLGAEAGGRLEWLLSKEAAGWVGKILP
jgi:hypothetical protein